MSGPADRAAWLAEHAACPSKQEPEKTDYVTVPRIGLDTAAEAGVPVVASPSTEHVFLMPPPKPSDHPDWCVCVKCKPKAA